MILKKVGVLAAFLLLPVALAGCRDIYNKAYYDVMENVVGTHKREILVDRVQDARDSQESAKEQFKSALDKFKATVNFEGGTLEQKYELLDEEYKESKKRADKVSAKIRAVADVSEALFEEWEKELVQYSSESLRKRSEEKLVETRTRYQTLIDKMTRAEAKMHPVLNTFRDQVLYLKHNLNAAAIASLEDTFDDLEMDVEALIREMEESIDEANSFIAELEGR